VADDRPETATDELTGEQKRANVIRLAFGDDERQYTQFVRILSEATPGDTAVVLRGSASTTSSCRRHTPGG
jgi:hypothetical protein